MSTIQNDPEIPQSSTQFSASNQPRISLIARDWSTIRRALLELIRVRFPSEWKDFGISGNGMAILEVVAYSHAQLGYYIDAQANEMFITTAKTLGGMRRLTSALNYRMQLATSAGVSLTTFISPTSASKIRLDAGTTFKAKNKTTWTLSDTTLIPENTSIYPPLGSVSNLILATEGEEKSQTFVSTGLVWQKFLIPDENVVEESIEVVVDGDTWYEADSLVFSEGYGFGVDRFTSDGTASQDHTLTDLWPRIDNFEVAVGSDPSTAVEWTQVDDFSGSGSTDTHYVLSVDPATGEGTVYFGDGFNGAIPTNAQKVVFTYNVIGPQNRYQVVVEPDGLVSVRFGDNLGAVIPAISAAIVVNYRVGSGLLGNINIADIDTNITGYLVSTGAAVSVRVQNTEPSSGAEAAETVDHAREYAPKVAASTGRASTANDYDGLLSTFVHPDYGKIAFGKAALHSEFPESNQVDVTLWSRDSDGRIISSPSALREAVKVYIESRADICHYIQHQGGEVVYADLDITVAIPSNLNVATILAEVNSAVVTYFSSSKVSPGKDVYVSQIVAVMQSISGVSYVIIDSIRLSLRSNFLYATGDGLKSRFWTGSFGGYDADLGAPVIAGTFSMTSGTKSVTDDSSGNLVGSIDASGTNEIVYDDAELEEDITHTGQNYRWYTPYYGYKVYEVPASKITASTGEVGSVGSPVEVPNTKHSTYGYKLVVTDGLQYAYAKSDTKFHGDVYNPAGHGAVSSGTGGIVKFYFKFANPITTGKVTAYCVYTDDANGTPKSEELADPLAQPVRETTAILKMGDKVVVDDGNGKFEWDIMPATPTTGTHYVDYDDRDEANTIIYEDEAVVDEEILTWKISDTSYRGRLQDVPLNYASYYGGAIGMSPLIRPGSVLFTDGDSIVTDTDNGDGSGTLVGDIIDTNEFNVIYYEDCDVVDLQRSDLGQAIYTNIKIPKNIVRPEYLNVNYWTAYLTLKTQVNNSGFEDLVFYDKTGTGVFDSVDVNGIPGSIATYFNSHAINYALGTFTANFKFTTTNPLKFSYTVRGGTFEMGLTSAFSYPAQLGVSYRKAVGGHFDVTFKNADTNVDLNETWNQALGGHFDMTFDSAPALNDLVTVDYRYKYALELTDQVLTSVADDTTVTVEGQLENYPVKPGSFIIRATSFAGAALEVRDDGRGNITGGDMATDGRNYIDYVKGVYIAVFNVALLSGSNVYSDYDSYAEPKDIIPILKNQIADVANVNLTQVDPRDF